VRAEGKGWLGSKTNKHMSLSVCCDGYCLILMTFYCFIYATVVSIYV